MKTPVVTHSPSAQRTHDFIELEYGKLDILWFAAELGACDGAAVARANADDMEHRAMHTRLLGNKGHTKERAHRNGLEPDLGRHHLRKCDEHIDEQLPVSRHRIGLTKLRQLAPQKRESLRARFGGRYRRRLAVAVERTIENRHSEAVSTGILAGQIDVALGAVIGREVVTEDQGWHAR